MPEAFTPPRESPEAPVNPLATRLAWLVLVIAVAFGLVWRARQYGAQFSFSVDELAIARNVTERSLAGLFQRLEFGQIAPIGFLLALKTSASLFGPFEWSLRLVPFLSGLAAMGDSRAAYAEFEARVGRWRAAIGRGLEGAR